MENETFKMTYSAEQRQEIEAIRSKYIPREPDKMAQLRALDESVGKKATMLSILIGVVGTLLLGLGMSLAMSDFGAALGAAAFPLGVGIGVVGLAILACAWPVYNRVVKQEREKIAPEILRLTDELMK